MKADRELDALVAEKVMGIKVDFTDWACGRDPSCGCYEAALDRHNSAEYSWYSDKGPVTLTYGFAEPIPFYSTDIAAAWQVIIQIESRGQWARIQSPWEPGREGQYKQWSAGFTDHGFTGWNGRPDNQCFADTAPLAICLAALKAAESASKCGNSSPDGTAESSDTSENKDVA